MSIRIGVAGLGRMGRIHARHLLTDISAARLMAVASADESDRQWANTQLPGINFCTSLATLLQQDIDAVVIATPSRLHPEHIAAARAAGKHIFCEKPLGTTLTECVGLWTDKNMLEGPVLMLGFMRRYDPSYRQAKALIDSGAIGQPFLYRGYTADSIRFMEASIRFAAYSDGQFLDMAVHDIDLMRWYLQAEPTTVYASGGSYVEPQFEQHGDGDNVAAFFTFDNGSMAFLYAGRTAAHGYLVESEIIGTKGSVRIGAQPNAGFVELLDQQGRKETYLQDFEARFARAFSTELEEFCRIVENDGAGHYPGLRDGYFATRIALAATQSFQEKTLVNIKYHPS